MASHPHVSAIQHGIWLDRQLNPGTNCYNVPVLIDPGGPVDLTRLSRTLSEAARRHVILRTGFEHEDGRLMALEQPEPMTRVELIDLSHLSPQAAEGACMEHATAVARTPFDPAQPPLFTVQLIRLDSQRSRLLIVADQLILDGMSIWMLACMLLERPVRNQRMAREGRLQFRDYVAELAQEDGRRRIEAARRYWIKELTGMPRSLDLPYDAALATGGGSAGASLCRVLDEELTASLRGLTGSGGATMYAVLLAGFSLMLERITGQRDLVIAVPVAARELAPYRRLLGSFVNVLPLCVHVDEGASSLELISQVQQRLRGALRHQSCPLHVLAEDLDCRAGHGRTPFTSVSFNGINFVDRGLVTAAAESFKHNFGIDLKMDVNCYVFAAPDQVMLRLDYRESLFRRETAEALLVKLAGLLNAMAQRPKSPVRELASGVPVPGGSPSADASWYTSALSVPDVFYRQVEEHGGRVAVQTVDGCLTYGALNRQSNRLARHLRGSLGSGENVGVLLHQEAIALPILALLKAGNPYVPMDPEYPTERLQRMADIAGVRTVLTDACGRDRAARLGRDVRVLCLEELLEICAEEDDADVHGNAAADSVAYVFFTSGSSGSPKGVVQTHRAILHFVSCYTSSARLTCEDRLSGLSSVSFDAFNNDFYGALLNGASYHPLSSRAALHPEPLRRWIEDHGITVWHSVPGIFRYAGEQWKERGIHFPSLRVVKLAGELIRPADLALCAGVTGDGARFLVSLGSTESTYSLANVLDCHSDQRRASIPVGRPVNRTQVEIRGEDGRAHEVLEAGELFIRSDFIPRSYLGDDWESRRTFVDSGGHAWYRTGDVARQLADGTYLMLGRRDTQVKINGCRVELGEVEVALLGHEAVREAAVTAEAAPPGGDRCLVAYYISRGDCPPQQLRSRLQQLLPAYMIPARFVELAELPLTTSGKIDRGRLAEAPAVRTRGGERSAPPTGLLERRLADLCRDLLGVEEVDADDDFFMIGGHSLLAMRLVQKIEDIMGVRVALQQVFDSRTISGIAELIRAADTTAAASITPASLQNHYAVSPGQQRLWAVCELEGGAPAYTMSGVYRIYGDLDQSRLRQAFCAIVSRHESLRTAFLVVEGSLRQRPQAQAEVDFARLRAGGLSDSEKWDLVRSEIRTPFDLSAGSLLRVRLYEWGERENVLSVCVHHIACDGWSVNVLVDEVAQEYQRGGRDDVRASADSIQYKDYAAWCSRALRSPDMEAHRAYWKEELRDLPAGLELPSARSRPGRRSFRGATVRSRLAGESWRAFARLCANRRATPMAGLLAILDVLLYRYTQETDIVVGVPWAGREERGLDRQVGFYVNTLPVRTRLRTDDGFCDVLDRVGVGLARARAHGRYPMDLLPGDLALRRDPGRSPLFDVILAERDIRSAARAFAGIPELKVEAVSIHPGTAKYDLSVYAAFSSEVCELEVEYSTDLFDPEQIERLTGHLAALVEAASLSPHQRISRLPMLTSGETARLHAMTGPVRPAVAATVVDLLAAQAQAVPDAIALVHRDAHWSYREIEAWSGRLAGFLRLECGVGIGDRVGIMLERTEQLVLGILGVLKTGAAYVPIDPAYPDAHVDYLLADARATHLITSQTVLSRKQWQRDQAEQRRRTIAVDAEWERIARYRCVPTVDRLTPLNPAYIIYTSGSTGRPKGVVVSHANAVNLLAWARGTFQRDGLERMLASTSICFDLSVFELMVPLACGTTIVLVDNILELKAGPGRPVVTFINTVPSAAAFCLREDMLPPEALVVALAGEPLGAALAHALCRNEGAWSVHNLYAPSETTTYSTHEVVSQDRLPSIGRPIDNTSVFVLDPAMSLAPLGVTGEIYIGGRGVAAGYWGDSERTAAAFVPSPFHHGQRLYRTGDYGKVLDNGCVHFIGRRDRQVKIRGHRIELDEVQADLLEHPQVDEAAVVCAEPEPGERFLVAYYSARGGLDRPQLAEWQARRLPAHMLPAAYVRVASLPRTPNGKLDRAALPPPDRCAGTAVAAPGHPRTAFRERLRLIWRETLDRTDVPDEADLFELGGTSLRAMKLALRLQQEFGVELTLPQLFEHATLPAMERLILSCELPAGAGIGRAPERRDYELTVAQRRIWIASQTREGSIAHNIAGAYRLTGSFEPAAFESALERVVSRHESLRTVFLAAEGGPRQRILDRAEVKIAFSEAGESGETEAGRLAELDARAPFDLAAGPLLRARVIRVGAEAHYFSVVIHHLVSDGWSLEILMRELFDLYRAFLVGGGDPLTALPVRFRDYVEWLRAGMGSERMRRARTYWHERLAGELPSLQLPREAPPGAPGTFAGREETIDVEAQLLDRLRRIAEEHDSTLFMVLLAAMNALLYRYTGQSEIILGVPVAGRTHRDLLGLVGLFVNLLPIRLEIVPDQEFRQLLPTVRRLLLDGLAHQDYPYGDMVAATQPSRPARRDIFDVAMAMLDFDGIEAVQVDDKLRAQRVQLSGITSRFDLSVFVTVAPGGLRVKLEYRETVFRPIVIATLARRFKRLLAEIAADPAKKIRDIGIGEVGQLPGIVRLPR